MMYERILEPETRGARSHRQDLRHGEKGEGEDNASRGPTYDWKLTDRTPTVADKIKQLRKWQGMVEGDRPWTDFGY